MRRFAMQVTLRIVWVTLRRWGDTATLSDRELSILREPRSETNGISERFPKRYGSAGRKTQGRWCSGKPPMQTFPGRNADGEGENACGLTATQIAKSFCQYASEFRMTQRLTTQGLIHVSTPVCIALKKHRSVLCEGNVPPNKNKVGAGLVRDFRVSQ